MESDFGKRFWALALVGVLCLVSTTLWAADITATIRGTVTDPSGAVVGKANILATNTATNLEYKTTSSSSGDYELVNLPIGSYKMTVQAAGFRTFAVTGISLNIDQVYVQPVKLQVGSATETVEVKASAVQVDTTNVQLGAVIGSQQMTDLPLIGRNWTQLQTLLPGVQAASDRFGSFSANGSQSQQNSFLINGNDSNDLPLNTPLYVPSVDAIGEFNYATSTLNPEYGRNSGGVLSATIKNGTNSFHGDAFEFYRDTFLNRPNYFQKPVVPIFHQNVYGGTVGGPIWKNKAFFFVSYQGIRARQPQTNNSQVLTAAERAGNFSAALAGPLAARAGDNNLNTCDNIAPFNNTTNPTPSTLCNTIPGTVGAVLAGFNANCAAGLTWEQCFGATGGRIPGSASTGFPANPGFNPISLLLTNTFVPLPNQAGRGFTFPAVTTVPRTHQVITREDFTLSSKDQLWGAFTYQHAPSSSDLAFTGATVPGFGSQQGSDVRQATANWTHTFSPTTINEFRLAFTRLNFQAVLPQKVVLPSSVGFTGINPQQPSTVGLPVISVNGGGIGNLACGGSSTGAGFCLGFSDNGPQPRIDETRQIADNFTKIIGKHSLKFGWNGSKFNVNNPFTFENGGHFDFSGDNTSFPFSTGDGFLDFLLGVPDDYSQSTNAVINAQAWESYAYAQDTWKARSDLTITLGVGWQVDTPLYQEQFKRKGIVCFIGGQQSTVFPNNGAPGGFANPAFLGPPLGLNYPGDKGCDTGGGVESIFWSNVGPRVGFAFSPDLGRVSGGKSGKFVVRGGFGIYYNRSEEEAALQDLGVPPFGVTSGGIGDIGGNPQFANPFTDIDTAGSIPNKFPAVFAAPGSLADFHFFAPIFLSSFNPKFQIPHSINYQLTVQRELPANTVVTVSYVGARGRQLQTTIDTNPITQAGHDACFLNPACAGNATARRFQQIFFPSHVKFGNGDIVPTSGTIASTGKSSYDSLQVSATKGYSHGLLFQASYTFSHSLDDASSFENAGFGGSVRGYNQFFPALNKGNSIFDARHRFVISPVYTIPDWRGIHALARLPKLLTKGWKISGIATLASGFPFDIRDSSGRSLFCTALNFYACADTPNFLGPGLVTVSPRDRTSFAAQSCFFSARNFAGTSLCGNSNRTFGREIIGTFGTLSRNKFHGPGINNIDVAVEKDVYFWPGNEKRYLELRLEAFNALNHTQFGQPNGSFTSKNFGRITTAAPGRLIQLGAKIYF